MSDCRASEADRNAFLGWVGRLVHAHRGQLLRVARREGLGPEDAFDAVQEAFQTFLTLPAAKQLAEAPEAGNEARNEESRRLLVGVTRNVARNRRRLAATARPHLSEPALLDALPAESPNVDDLLAAAEEELRLRGCVQELGEMQRAVVTLRMLDEADGEDVAHTLGITPGHVAVLLHRAKANLLACMSSGGPDAAAPRRNDQQPA